MDQVEDMKQAIREKDIKLDQAERRGVHLEVELQECVQKQKQITEEKNKIAKDNLELTAELRQAKKDLMKLQQFKKAVQNTFDEESQSQIETSSSDLQRSFEKINSSPISAPVPLSSDSFTSTSPQKKEPTVPISPMKSPHRCSNWSDDVDFDTLELLNQIDRSLQLSSLNRSPASTRSPGSPWTTPGGSGKPMDSKTFFSQARKRLTFDQFNDFLENIKRLNAQLQSRETIEKCVQSFGEHPDLLLSLRQLLSRHADKK